MFSNNVRIPGFLMHGHIYVHGGMIGFDCVFVSSPAKVSAFICGTRYNMVTVAERKAHQPAQLLFKGVVIQTSDIFSVCLNMFSVASVFLDFFLAPESNPNPHEGKSFSLFSPKSLGSNTRFSVCRHFSSRRHQHGAHWPITPGPLSRETGPVADAIFAVANIVLH